MAKGMFCTFFLLIGLGLATVQTNQDLAFGVNIAYESRKEQNPHSPWLEGVGTEVGVSTDSKGDRTRQSFPNYLCLTEVFFFFF